MSSEKTIENFRSQLQTQMREEFFDKLQNEDDPSAERYSLIETIRDGLARLVQLEGLFLSELLEDSADGVCPSCLINNATDLSNIKSVAHAFNNYLEDSSPMQH